MSEDRKSRSKPKDVSIAELESARAKNLRQLLLRASRSINQDVTTALRSAGFTNLKNSHVFCLANIELAGTTIAYLAERSSVSKQAASKLVSELVELGYLSVASSPTDGRAVMVKFTTRGRALMEQSFELFADLERGYKSKIGSQDFKILKRALQLLAP